LAAQRRELLLLITRLEDFAARVKDGLQHADWHTKRDLVRTLVRRVEIGPDGVNVVFRVDPAVPPSPPPDATLQDCARREVAVKRHILADEHTQAGRQSEAHTLVVRIPEPDGKPASIEAGFEIEDAEHLHAVLGNGILVRYDADVTKAQSLDQCLDDLVVRHRSVGCGCGRRWHQSQLLPGDLAVIGNERAVGHTFSFLRLVNVIEDAFDQGTGRPRAGIHSVAGAIRFEALTAVPIY
jgi:hypothetical protein